MNAWLATVTEPIVVLIDTMALALILFGTLQAFVRVAGLVIRRDGQGVDRRETWLTYARWLVAGLTFQLAADIIESAVAPTWESIGKLAAIAAIRTFLNYFLERDLVDVRQRQRPSGERS